MIDPEIAQVILGGAMGLTVLGVTEVVKKFFYKPPKVVPKAAGYVISLVVSAGATLYYLLSTHAFEPVTMAGYTIYVWAVANGIFKATHTPTSTS